MVIQTNILAMNANRQFGITVSKQKKSSEKLSSGFRINRAADDAAGLTISEKMRRQIRGLTQASNNAQDGISMVQTAEGALNEVHDMLQRMNELCIKAANDTLTYEDREAVQNEIEALTDEMDHIGDGTTFNTIKLFDGLPQPKAEAVNPGIKINGNSGSVTQAKYEPEREAFYKNDPVKTGDMIEIPRTDGKYIKAATKAEVEAYEEEWKIYENKNRTYEEKKKAYDKDLERYNNHEIPNPPDISTVPEKPEDKAVLMEVYRANREIMDYLGSVNASHNADIADSVRVSYSSTNPGVFDLHFYGPLQVELQIGTEKDHTIP